jgi:hypothetical protein
MGAESVTISVGLPPSAAAKIAMLYFDIFPRKLGLVLDHRDAEVVGIAGLKYNGAGSNLGKAFPLQIANPSSASPAEAERRTGAPRIILAKETKEQ